MICYLKINQEYNSFFNLRWLKILRGSKDGGYPPVEYSLWKRKFLLVYHRSATHKGLELLICTVYRVIYIDYITIKYKYYRSKTLEIKNEWINKINSVIARKFLIIATIEIYTICNSLLVHFLFGFGGVSDTHWPIFNETSKAFEASAAQNWTMLAYWNRSGDIKNNFTIPSLIKSPIQKHISMFQAYIITLPILGPITVE